MAHRDFKVDRLVCCNQGSIHTGIVLNPAGPCAARHGPYGVSDFRVAIDSLPCDEVVVSVGCLPAFPFQVFLKQFYSFGTATVPRGICFREVMVVRAKSILDRFETSSKSRRWLDAGPFSSSKQSQELMMGGAEQHKEESLHGVLQQF